MTEDPRLLPGKPQIVNLPKSEFAAGDRKAIDADAIHRVVEIDVAARRDRAMSGDRLFCTKVHSVLTCALLDVQQIVAIQGLLSPSGGLATRRVVV